MVVTVQLEENGPITEMDERFLEKRVGELDNEHEHTTWVEYWLKGRNVHRSVHVTLKKAIDIFQEQGAFGG